MIASEAELRALMIDSQNGNALAHRTLLIWLSRHLRDYYKNKLARIGRSAADVEDLMQDTLMAIHSRRHTYDPRRPFTPWVYAIARYKLVDHLRRTNASITDVPINEAGDITAQDDHAGTESALDLQRLLSALPEKMQRAIRCVKLEGLSVAEAAARCGTSESAVKINVHRGLKFLAMAVTRGRTS